MITIDGVPIDGGHSNSYTYPNFAASLDIGGNATLNWYQGYVQEIRQRNDAAWTADFSGSLPTVPYTDDVPTKLLIHCTETLTGTSGSNATFAESGEGRTVTEVGNAIRNTSEWKFAS